VNGLPRLGFLGTGWIGRSRLRSLVDSGTAEVVVVADPDGEARRAALEIAPNAAAVASYGELLEFPLDAVVIATPSGEHAEQCILAFERGLHVFCQKPLGCTAREVSAITRAAERADRALGVDLSYRETAAQRALTTLVERGEIGALSAIDLVFHNAYGPSRGWADDVRRAGGGCLMDLGVHLLDAAFGLVPNAAPIACSASLFAGGRALRTPPHEPEDFAFASVTLDNGVAVRLACSWRSAFGAEAQISVSCFGTAGGAELCNVNGSFFDFRCDRFEHKTRVRLVEPPDAWGGRALVRFVESVAGGAGYRADPRLVDVARTLDALYGRAPLVAADRAAFQPSSVVA